MLYQQGDVIIQSTHEIPKKATKSDPSERGFVLAEGEVTGHAHVIDPVFATLFTTEDERFLQVHKSATVKHEEHGNITLPKGNYKLKIVKEYDHFDEEAREVRD